MSVRVRFAPSPTGLLHVGALRTVLFDYLFARNKGGQLILRIEDTDRTRYNPESEQEFVDTLRWVGIQFDEGPHVGGPHAPYRQSERAAEGIYAKWIAELEAKGHAYKAFETSQELEEMREFQQINKQPLGYFGGDWRDASPEKVQAAIAEGKPYVIRQKMPRDKKIVVQDLIRGRIEFDSNTLPDPVLIKADGMPTYHFAAMVDDHLMGITHVLRGEEWISTSPYHWTLFEMFGWQPPTFVHCPVIVGKDGKKLSKRHGATRVLDYMAQGYMKGALKNFIALIGWAPGDDREVYEDEQELIQAFSIERLQPSPGQFDMEKLRWLNGHRIRLMSPEEILAEIEGLLAEAHTVQYWENFVDEPMPNQKPIDGKDVLGKVQFLVKRAHEDRDYVLKAIKEERERVGSLVDFGDACEFFIVADDSLNYDPKATAKWFTGQAHVPALFDFLTACCDNGTFGAETPAEDYEKAIKDYFASTGLDKLGPIVHPTRVALTGKTVGPGLFELMAVLGPERIKNRVARARTMLS